MLPSSPPPNKQLELMEDTTETLTGQLAGVMSGSRRPNGPYLPGRGHGARVHLRSTLPAQPGRGRVASGPRGGKRRPGGHPPGEPATMAHRLFRHAFGRCGGRAPGSGLPLGPCPLRPGADPGQDHLHLSPGPPLPVAAAPLAGKDCGGGIDRGIQRQNHQFR